ncbi:tyrosine-type recombinase/integrase [Methanococcus voltae]|uniref:Integrase family protein n=1 Tax=Methanococcus voltae (strain ATCC BAA-1334 / A3) TaxID=456320 RepID=D7DSQ3_METV3|nr:tyrosine-type recombinase/integrase [Methanococcus voltae]MCS3901764.1 integrase/recombinase XerD [Methanococcus voltae]
MKNVKRLITFNSDERFNAEEYVEKYKYERELDGIAKSTLQIDVTKLKVFLTYCNSIIKRRPENLTKLDFGKFFMYLANERRIAKNTEIRYYNLLVMFYKVMNYDNFEEFETECKERKRFKKFDKKHYDYVTTQDMDLIFQKLYNKNNYTQDRDAVLLRTLWDTGCRVSEILNSKLKDYDGKNGVIVITKSKNYTERRVILANDTKEALNYIITKNRNKNDNDYLFQKLNGEQINRNAIYRVFNACVKELKAEGKLAKNRRIVLHSIRHGCCVNLLTKGVNLDEVSRYMGHNRVETTMIYAHNRERTNESLNNIKNIL